MAFLHAVRWVKHVRGTQQINDSHPHALAYEIDSHELENASHFAMRISLSSSLIYIIMYAYTLHSVTNWTRTYHHHHHYLPHQLI